MSGVNGLTCTEPRLRIVFIMNAWYTQGYSRVQALCFLCGDGDKKPIYQALLLRVFVDSSKGSFGFVSSIKESLACVQVSYSNPPGCP